MINDRNTTTTVSAYNVADIKASSTVADIKASSTVAPCVLPLRILKGHTMLDVSEDLYRLLTHRTVSNTKDRI